MSDLCLHRGARLISQNELDAVDCPPPTATWYPLRHRDVLNSVLETLLASSYQVQKMQISLSANDARFFGTLDLTTPVAEGTSLAVGIRNSTDKTFPLGFCAGSRVFVCDNLAFHSELLVARKHTLNGRVRFQEAIAQAVQSLDQFRLAEAQRIEHMRTTELSSDRANSLILQSYQQGIVPLRTLPNVLHDWLLPAHADFEKRTLWSLANAFTGVLKSRSTTNPQQFALQTIRLNALLTASAC